MTPRSTFLRAALIAGFALSIVQSNQVLAQSFSTGIPGGASATSVPTPSYTPPVVTRQPEPPQIVGTPMRNMPDRLQELRMPVNPVAAQVNAATPRRAVLNRLENRLATDQALSAGNTAAKTPSSAATGRALLDSAQPIL